MYDQRPPYRSIREHHADDGILYILDNRAGNRRRPGVLCWVAEHLRPLMPEYEGKARQ